MSNTKLIAPRKHAQEAASVTGLYLVSELKAVAFADCRMNGQQKGVVHIGRARHCDIKLLDTSVSTVHCIIRRQPDGSWMLHDEASRNGVYINDIRVTQEILRPGMKLHLGATELIVLGPDGKLPISARTYTSFLAVAQHLYGSVRAAAKMIGRSRETVRRAYVRRKQRQPQGPQWPEWGDQ